MPGTFSGSEDTGVNKTSLPVGPYNLMVETDSK